MEVIAEGADALQGLMLNLPSSAFQRGAVAKSHYAAVLLLLSLAAFKLWENLIRI